MVIDGQSTFSHKKQQKKYLRGTNLISLYTYNCLIFLNVILSMREKELLKVALQGDFYVLKQMCASQTPSWCIIEKSSKLSDIEFCISIMRHSSKYILNASERIKVSDLINLSEAGFQVIRISLSDKLVVKKFNPLTKSWIKLSSFPKVCLRENFLSEKLCNRDTILID